MGAEATKQQDIYAELLGLLIQNGRTQEALEFSTLLSLFAATEMKYAQMLSELSTAQEQLAALDSAKYRTAAIQEMEQMQAQATHKKEALSVLKEGVTGQIKETLGIIKRHGISALDKAAGLLGIQKALVEMKSGVQDIILSVQGRIDRINAIGSELHAFQEQGRNLGRVLAGKERKEPEPYREYKGTVTALIRLLKRHKTALKGVVRNIDEAIVRVEQLRQAAERNKGTPSIREGAETAPKPKAQPPLKNPNKRRHKPCGNRRKQASAGRSHSRKVSAEPER